MVQIKFTKLKFIIFLLLVVSLLLAEHYIPSEVIEGSTADSLISSHEGTAARRVAYLFIGTLGLFLLMRGGHKVLDLGSPFVLALGLLFSWSMLSLAWADEPLIAARRLMVLCLMYLGAAGLVTYLTTTGVIIFIAITAATHTFIGVIAEITLGVFNILDPSYRFAGTLRWNEQGITCLFLALSALAASDCQKKHRNFFRGLSLYGCSLLLLTRSRSSMIGLVLGSAFYVAVTRSQKVRNRLAVSSVTLVLLLWLFGGFGEIYAFLSRSGEGVENLTGRLPLWEECMRYISERPIEGYGYEDFWTTQRVDYMSNQFHWGISAAHSGYLESLLTLGLVGLILHISVLIIGLFSAVKRYRSTNKSVFSLAASCFVVFLIAGTLEALLIVKASPVSFFVCLLVCSLCLKVSSVIEETSLRLNRDLWAG